ncbi:MAG: putative addiction module antidote protein [Elusimicrobia bacterium]|nr:putative addiction module antidote protein [Elusimicrobiota bacterium]MBP9127996.1 putative addiction module antidote protein [Elusimicrobiota bacterium]MBP9698981.1 putative addiction module antidote protein [Elusimicrobiota bacterium]
MNRLPPYVSHADERIKELRDPEEAMHYLNACAQIAFEEGEPDTILMGIYNVARAQGLTTIAKRAHLHRETLSRMLSKKGNPEWNSLFRLLKALKVKTRFETITLAAA